MTDSTLLALFCLRAAVAYAQFAGTLRIPAFMHERRHIVMMNIDDDSDRLVHVNSQPVALLTRFDGVDIVGVPW